MRVTANPPRQYHSNGCTAAAFRGWTRRAVRGIGWEFVHVCIDDALFVVLALAMAFHAAIARLSAIDHAVALYGSMRLRPLIHIGQEGCIALKRVVGGLHHDYYRIWFSMQTAFAHSTETKRSASRPPPQPLHPCNLRSPCHHARQPVRHV
jgi:hypothetical protein